MNVHTDYIGSWWFFKLVGMVHSKLSLLSRRYDSCRGASCTEYALLVIAVSLVSISGLQYAGGKCVETYAEVHAELGGGTCTLGPDGRTPIDPLCATPPLGGRP